MNTRYTVLQHLSNRTINVSTDSASAAISVAQALDATYRIPAVAWAGSTMLFDSATTPLPVVIRS
jgi:hypothetical protein